MTREELEALQSRGWTLTRDGSTGTAYFSWDDPEETENGWELYVLHTAGHGNRFTLEPVGSGLTERRHSDFTRLTDALRDAERLLEDWQGELPDEMES